MVVEATGMTQADVAAALGVSRSAVVKWLSGEARIKWPAWRVLLGIAREVECTPQV